MLPARLAGAFPTLQVGVLLHHTGVKIVLPLRQIGPVADNFFGAQAVVLCQRHKDQVQMGRFFIHVYHSRNDVLPAHPVNEEVRRPLEVGRYLLWGLALEKLRAGGNQRVHKPGTVLAGAASGLLNAALNEVVVAALRLDDVEVVLAPAGVNVRVAGVLLLFPFMVGFQRPRRVALVLLKSQNCVLCQILSDLLLRTVRGLFWGRGVQTYGPAPHSPEKSLIYGLFSALICPFSSGVSCRWRSSAGGVSASCRYRSISPGWNRKRKPPRIRRTASRCPRRKSPLPAPCPAARPPSGTTCSRWRTKSFADRHRYRHRPAQGSFRPRSCSTPGVSGNWPVSSAPGSCGRGSRPAGVPAAADVDRIVCSCVPPFSLACSVSKVLVHR